MEEILGGIGKMKQYYLNCLFYLVGMFMLAACNHHDQYNNSGIHMTKSEKEVLFQMILDHSDLQQYLSPYSEGRLQLKVKSNDDLGKNLIIEKFGRRVEFIDNSPNVPLFEVHSFKAKDTRVTFDIAYEVEGVRIQGILVKKDGDWSFSEMDVFEG